MRKSNAIPTLLIATCTAFIPAATDAADGFAIKALERNDWRFPIVQGSSKAVVDRINYVMFVNAFFADHELIPPANAEDSLKVLTDRDARTISQLDFDVLRNDRRVFSVQFTGESCGAYCESFARSVAFDAVSGRLLTDLDLFTEAGRAALVADIRAGNQKTLQKHISHLRGAKPSADRTRDDISAAIAMYQQCLTDWRMPDHYAWPQDMQIDQATVTFFNGRCSNHAARVLDDLGDLRNTFSFEKLKPRLSPYGRRVLLGENVNAKPMSPFGQLLRGTIGKTPISMYIGSPSESGSAKEMDVSGYYFYDRYRKGLRLWGKAVGLRLEFTETDNEKAQATITLNVTESGIHGRWQSLNNKNAFDVVLGH